MWSNFSLASEFVSKQPSNSDTNIVCADISAIVMGKQSLVVLVNVYEPNVTIRSPLRLIVGTWLIFVVDLLFYSFILSLCLYY